MGKQSAKIYYQGKYHSDILCEHDPTTPAPLFVNNYQMYIGNKLIWERKPANLVFLAHTSEANGDFICVSNDLVHCSSMSKGISSLDGGTFSVSLICTFSNKFVCYAVSGDCRLLLKSDNGFKWERFYESDQPIPISRESNFAKCKYNEKDCIAILIQNKILYFDSDFRLIRTIESQLDPTIKPLVLVGGRTLYLHGYDDTSRSNGIMEEYVNGELTIRHRFSVYKDMNGYALRYINGEDTVYGLYVGLSRFSAKQYIHGEVYPINTADVNADIVGYPDIPYMSQESVIVKCFGSDKLYHYFELKNGSIIFRTKSKYQLEEKIDGITLYNYIDTEKNITKQIFTKGDFFSVDLEKQESVEIKGLKEFTPDTIRGFLYLSQSRN